MERLGALPEILILDAAITCGKESNVMVKGRRQTSELESQHLEPLTSCGVTLGKLITLSWLFLVYIMGI